MEGTEGYNNYQIIILEGIILCTKVTIPNAVLQQSTKLRNRHAALGDGFINRRQARINKVSDGVNRSLVVLVVSQSYRCHPIK